MHHCFIIWYFYLKRYTSSSILQAYNFNVPMLPDLESGEIVQVQVSFYFLLNEKKWVHIIGGEYDILAKTTEDKTTNYLYLQHPYMKITQFLFEVLTILKQ
ncbi:unnamed protein product [Meganyctiphanes norvegica]|uniref:Uncharacterized protein n=1 Tax=Meganyctiphanes norvegica TaxID=48144 RepID=A0AAV2SUU1_MEGNR